MVVVRLEIIAALLGVANLHKAVAQRYTAPIQETNAVHLALAHLDGIAAVLEHATLTEENAARTETIVNLETTAISYEASTDAVRIITVQHTYLGASQSPVPGMVIQALRERSRHLIKLLSPALERLQPAISRVQRRLVQPR